jgi:putative exporter of polyketide antibiotics
MIYGMINSIAFLVLNLMEYLETLEKKSYLVYGVIGAAQIFLFLMFKMVFFSLIYESAENAD